MAKLILNTTVKLCFHKNIVKKLTIVLALAITISKGYGANIIIKYIIEKDSTVHTKHSVSDYMLGIVPNNWDNVDLNSKQEIPAIKNIMLNRPNQEIVVITYEIARSGIYFIKDIFGHEVFLDQSMDGDTIPLKLSRLYKKIKLNLNDSVKSTWFYKISYPPKYKYMGFFDSIAYLHGDLRGGGGFSFKGMNDDLSVYLPAVNKAYTDRVRFYKTFVNNYDMPSKLKYYALKEIQYCYYNDLLDPLLESDATLIKNYPAAIQDTVRKISYNLNDKDLFENISFYRTVILGDVSLSIQDGFLQSLRDEFDNAYMTNRLQYCKKNLRGVTQGYVLAWYMQILSQKDAKETFALFYNTYDYHHSAPGVNKFVETLYLIATRSGTVKPTEVLNLVFEDNAHKNRKLGEVFNKDIILIDCWATWCIPCREQMPALDSLADEYKEHVQFVSVSADQFTSKWDDWLAGADKTNKFILQLHAPNGFQNIFFRNLMINSIPRYILLSRTGKILNASMPFPSENELFKKELQKYL